MKIKKLDRFYKMKKRLRHPAKPRLLYPILYFRQALLYSGIAISNFTPYQ